ncbi:MAG: PEP-CTERM sorting domain-containing protein [Proteobacteria bacterium]|nr:MAG: PEP-CTERM sorting domain-containing protein [Pseudomonadota bacterium]
MKKLLTTVALSIGAVSSAFAGPYILAGTDADDHGSATATTNVDGWLFMQRALENLAQAPSLTNTSKNVAILGSTGSAQTAALSAFNKSSLATSGWTVSVISTGDFANFFATGLGTTSILMMDSGNNVGGGVSGSQFTAYATDIDSFLGAGGGLFSQANGYQWLSALLPSVNVVGSSSTGLELTAAGNAAFPGLTNSDLSAGPWHNYFTGTGSIPVLAVDDADNSGPDGVAVIIGAAGGSITEPGDPNQIPEPGTLALLGIAMAGVFLRRRR